MMGWLRSIVREVVGLFVDDGSFAGAILVWVAAVVMGARLVRGAGWVMFVGLAVILVESVLRFARRRRK
jgi:hypothetical protein